MVRAGQAAALVIGAALMLASGAHAATWFVAPLRVELSNARRTEALQVRNDSDAPVTIQVRAFAWTQPDGDEHLADTDDLLITPPIFTVDAHAQQIVRLGLRDATGRDNESAYRLLLDEVPGAAPQSSGLNIALRISMPVFVAGTRPAQRALQWSIARDGDAFVVSARNLGTANAHVHALSLSVAAPPPTPPAEPFASLRAPAYVLPGAEHRWRLVPSPPAPLPAVDAALRVHALTEHGALDADVAPSP